MATRAALVLAGGKARRFQTPKQNWQDKALVLFEGKPFLIHVVESVACVVDEVIVCVDNKTRKERYLKILEKYNLQAKIVIDEKTNVGGPNRAVLTGLKATQTDLCLTIPCDMPLVKPNIVEYLFNSAEHFDVVMPMWPNGKLETLLMVLKRSIGLEIVQTLCQLGRSHADEIPRAAPKTLLTSPLKNIKNLDPKLESFININTKEDLKNLQTRNTQGPIQENIQLYQEAVLVSDLQLIREAVEMRQKNDFAGVQEKFDLCKKHFESCNNFFWTALACECKGEFFDASNNYGNEAKIYEKNHCTQLLKRAFSDKNRCESITQQ